MLDAKNNAALRAYMNFKDYRQTVDLLEQKSTPKKETGKKGIMSITRNTMSQQAKEMSSNGTDKELRKVLEYVKMIEGMKNGS